MAATYTSSSATSVIFRGDDRGTYSATILKVQPASVTFTTFIGSRPLWREALLPACKQRATRLHVSTQRVTIFEGTAVGYSTLKVR